MNEQIEKLMYHAGLTSQGCWDEMDDYDKQAIEKFAELLIFDILNVITNDDALGPARINTLRRISDRYGVQRKMN